MVEYQCHYPRAGNAGPAWDGRVTTVSRPWLWTTCWRTDLQPEMMMTGFSGEQIESTDMAIFAKTGVLAVPEQTLQEQIHHLASVVVQLENLWLTESDIQQKIEPDSWGRFMEAIYQNLYDLAIEVADKK